MLLCEHGRGGEHRDLFPFHHRLESGADRDLGFAKTDIATNQAVHRTRLLHVVLGRVDRLELVGGFTKREGMLELALPLAVGTESVAELGRAFRLHREHFARVIEDGSRGIFFRTAPFRIRKRAQRRGFLADADVARNEISLLERDIEFRFIGKLERQHFLQTTTGGRDFHQLEKPADAMLQMHDEIAFGQFAEIDLRAVASMLLRALEASTAVSRGAAEQFGGGQNDQLAGRESEAARERSFRELNAVERAIRTGHEFAEALDFAFGLRVDHDARAARSPFIQAGGELAALRFRNHEIAHRELADVRVEKGAVVVLRLALFNPAGTDYDICGRAFFVRFNRDLKIILRDVVAHGSALIFRRAEQHIDGLEIPDRGLRIDVELPQRFDFVAEEFQAHGKLRLPRKEIEDSAANGELPARRDLRDAVVAGLVEQSDETFHRFASATFQRKDGRVQRGCFRRGLIQ